MHVGDDRLSVVVDLRHGVPAIVYWGAPLRRPDSTDLESIARATQRPVEHGGLDVVAPLTLVALHSSGTTARPGLEGHRPGGRQWAPVMSMRESSAAPTSLRVTSVDAVAELELVTSIEVVEGVMVVDATVANRGSSRYLLTTLAVTLPLDQQVRDVVSLGGRWARESHVEVSSFDLDVSVETRSGRSSHERQPSLWFTERGVTHQTGRTWSTHLAWSGNHSLHAQRLADGRSCVQLGELLHPGEVCLEAGEQYSTPRVVATYSPNGLFGVANLLHGYVRRGRHSSPRKVMLNTWEAVYFKHDFDTLVRLAERAARVGVERFVLDDGWFSSRRDDRRGLGDWVVSREVYPNGLSPLIDRVRGLGMDFGIWVEPECVNEDSDVYRAHPEWALVDVGRDPLRARNQLVLNLAHPDAFAHVLGQLDRLLADHDISYVKWDMNRPHVAGSGVTGSAGTHAQTTAVHRLIDELHRRHPNVEFESCASGGGRVDLAMVSRVDRVWASDTIDALERHEIHRGLTLTLPPEIVGSHIGSRVAHTTGRRHTLAFRGLTAMFFHLGIEWDLTSASEDELDALSALVALYVDKRELLHRGTFSYCDLAQPVVDPSAVAYCTIAFDVSEGLVCYAQLRTERHQTPDVIRIGGLDPDASYRVAVVDVPGGVHTMGRRQPEWLTSGVVMRGSDLETIGIQPPAIVPESAVLFSLHRQ